MPPFIRREFLDPGVAASLDLALQTEISVLRAFRLQVPPGITNWHKHNRRFQDRLHTALNDPAATQNAVTEARMLAEQILGPEPDPWTIEREPWDPQLADAVGAIYCDLVSLSALCQDGDSALRAADHLERLANSFPPSTVYPGMRRHQALAHLFFGRLDTANECLAHAGWNQDGTESETTLSHRYLLATLLVLRRETEDAAITLAAAIEESEALGYSGWLRAVALIRILPVRRSIYLRKSRPT